MLKKRRVLIIDDEAGFTRLLKLNLHHTGKYIAQDVNDPARAMAIAIEFLPDVVLLDVMMPSMDGGEVAIQFRSNPKLHDVPIVFLTAAVKRNEIQSNKGSIGGLPFVAKPMNLQELIQCIERQFGKQTPGWQ